MTILPRLFLMFFALSSAIIFAQGYQYKTIEDFPTIEDFGSAEEFEVYYQKYLKDCLGNTFGGSAGIPCFIGYELWDRELNTYYQKLKDVLDEATFIKLRDSERAWITERDLTIETAKMLAQKYLDAGGTAYQLIYAGTIEDISVPIMKHRTLILIALLELYESEAN